MKKELTEEQRRVIRFLAVVLNTLTLFALWKIFGLPIALMYFGSDLLCGLHRIAMAIENTPDAQAISPGNREGK